MCKCRVADKFFNRFLHIHIRQLNNETLFSHVTRIHLFVNELIDIEPGKKHPLPWYPPICHSPESFNEKYITRTLLDATAQQQQSSDASLKPLLYNLVQTADLAEIGQRILTAIEAVRVASLVII